MQEPAQTVHGTWIATAGQGQTLHGTWTGSVLPGHPDAAEGTWMLASSGRIVLHGTWRAQKSRQRWEGHWTAQTDRGESLAGDWGADVEHWQGKTFQELLELTLQEEVSGWWQVGPRQGNWWLKGSQPHGRRSSIHNRDDEAEVQLRQGVGVPPPEFLVSQPSPKEKLGCPARRELGQFFVPPAPVPAASHNRCCNLFHKLAIAAKPGPPGQTHMTGRAFPV